MASARRLSKVLQTKGGFRQWIAAPKSPRVISNGSVQNHERWMGSNPGQEASPMRFSGRAAPWYLDGLGALYGLPARRLAPWRLRPCPRRCQEQQHRGRVEQQCHDEDEPPQHVLIAGTEQCGEI